MHLVVSLVKPKSMAPVLYEPSGRQAGVSEQYSSCQSSTMPGEICQQTLPQSYVCAAGLSCATGDARRHLFPSGQTSDNAEEGLLAMADR